MRKRIYFKVVRRMGGGLFSVAVSALHRDLRVRYLPLEWVKAPIGGCLVFDNLQLARDFCGFSSPMVEIWSCEVRGAVKLPEMVLFPALGDLKEIRAVWGGASHYYPTHAWPDGTKAFRQVKLLEIESFE